MNAINKIKKLNIRYFAQMRYPAYLNKLAIKDNSIFLECQQGNSIDGNIWYIAKELMSDPRYKDYSLYISAGNQAVKDKVRRLIDSCRDLAATVEIVRTYSYKYYKLLASCKYIFSDNTLVPVFIKKEGQIYINTWHGTPLKTLGRNDRVHAALLGNIQKNFVIADYLLCPNMFTFYCLNKDYMLENLSQATVLVNGYPRNTVFFDQKKREIIREKYEFGSKKVYAYLPTWRSINSMPDDQGKKASFSEVTDYWLRQIDERLCDDEVMIVKAHVCEENSFHFNQYRHIHLFSDEEETYEFLTACDCLITDYSSVMFDYAISGRKVVLFAYDEKQYSKEWGLQFDIRELPFPIVESVDKLVNEMRSSKDYDDTEFLKRYCKYDSADATSELIRRVICGEDVGMTEFTVPSNGKKNILMYSGNLAKNGITTALRGLLNNIDTSQYNFFLNFDAASIGPNKNFLFDLPATVGYTCRIGRMSTSFREKLIMKAFDDHIISFDNYWKLMRPAYEREVQRQFGGMKFDVAIQFTGYEYKKMLTYSLIDAKRIFYVHNNMVEESRIKKNQRRDVLKYSFNHYDRIIGVSEAMVQSTREIAEADVDVEVIYNNIDIKKITKGSGSDIEFGADTQSTRSMDELKSILDGPGKVFISVGRFSPEKGHDRLVRAFDRYWQDNKEDYLIVLGGNERFNCYTKLIEQINELASADHIVLIKRMDNPYPLMKSCDGLILSSYYEGFGLVLIEGDILKIPVVSVDIEAPRIFMQNHGGTLVENSEDGILEGFNLLKSGNIKTMDVDYALMNRENTEKFEKLI